MEVCTINQENESQAEIANALLALLVRSKKLYPYGIPESFLKKTTSSEAGLDNSVAEITRWGRTDAKICIVAQVENTEIEFSCLPGQLLLSIIEKGLKLDRGAALIFALKEPQQISQEICSSILVNQRLIVFGKELLNFQYSQSLPNILVTHNLNEIQNNITSKRAAWENLKDFIG